MLTAARSLLTAAAVVGATVLVLTPSYQQNDDPVMAMIVSGTGIALQPDPHLMFTHIVIGRTLAGLYTLASGMPWYGLYLLTAHLLAQAALIHALAMGPSRRRAIPAYLLYWAAVGIYFPLRLQFTSTALVCVQAGGLLAVASLGSTSTGRARTARLGAAGALIVLGSAIRFDALLLGLVCALPVAILPLWSRRDVWRPALAVVLAVGAAALILREGDRAAYRADPGWQAFREMNVVRARMVDYELGAFSEATAPIYARLGWSENDALLQRQWFYPDPAVFSVQGMEALVEEAPTPPLGFDRIRRRLVEAFARPALVPVLLVLPFLMGGGRQRRVVGMTLGTGVVVVGLLAVFLKAPDQVVMPTLSFAALVALVLRDEAARRSPATGTRLALGLAVLGVVFSLGLRHRDATAARALNQDLHESLALLDTRGDRLYVAWAGHFPYRGILPLESPSSLGRLRLYSLGWPQRSPIADRMLDAFGISDLFRALCERDDVLLIAERGSPPPLEVYGSERYGLDVRFEERLNAPSFPVHSCEERPGE